MLNLAHFKFYVSDKYCLPLWQGEKHKMLPPMKKDFWFPLGSVWWGLGASEGAGEPHGEACIHTGHDTLWTRLRNWISRMKQGTVSRALVWLWQKLEWWSDKILQLQVDSIWTLGCQLDLINASTKSWNLPSGLQAQGRELSFRERVWQEPRRI